MNERESKLKNEKDLRLKFYDGIRKAGDFNQTFIAPPPSYWLSSNLFSISPDFENEKTHKKATSFLTILSIWNCMIGSGIVNLPYAVKQSGIIPYIILNIIFFLICYYTCQVICKTGGHDNDYSDTVHRYLGTKYGYLGRVIQITFSIMINIGGTYIYFLIINQNLYPLLASLFKLFGFNLNPSDPTPFFNQFSLIYCGFIMAILLFPLIIMKQVNFLIKINSYGIYFVSVLIVYVIIIGIISLSNTDFDFKYLDNVKGSEIRHLLLFGENSSTLLGILSSSYFSHSFILPIIKNNQNQNNNKRDLFIGYFLVFLTYLSVGLLGYVGFSGLNFKDADAFHKNWFQFLNESDPLGYLLRFLSIIQLCSVFPILAYCARIQLFGTFYNNAYPSKKHIIIYALLIIASSLLILYLFYEYLDKVISFIGATSGFALIFIIPLSVNVIYYRLKHPERLKYIERLIEDDTTENYNPQIINGPGLSKKPYSELKNVLFYISQGILMALGVFVLVSQFITINFFGVHIYKP